MCRRKDPVSRTHWFKKRANDKKNRGWISIALLKHREEVFMYREYHFKRAT
jgi:hypothetical protein|tara:strand:- start:225 stop:377 length:153 start_codon:yes stop_codon:yes gene_type:complete